MSVGFIGAGQLACALARGFTAAGERAEAGTVRGGLRASGRRGDRAGSLVGFWFCFPRGGTGAGWAMAPR